MQEKKDSGFSLGIAPIPTMFLGIGFALVGMFLAVMVATSQPWLGIKFKPNDDGTALIIGAVNRDDLKQTLSVGQEVTAFRSKEGSWETLTSTVLMEDPDGLSSYARYNAFLRQQALISNTIETGHIEFVTRRGDLVSIDLDLPRPMADLPPDFWIVEIGGVIALMLGISIWSFKRGKAETRLFLISGVGYFIMSIVTPVYATRELGLNADLFQFLSAINQLGGALLFFATPTLLFYYPLRLFSQPIALIIGSIVGFVWLNKVNQWFGLPGHDYYAIFPVIFVLSGIAISLQWSRTKRLPVQRAILKWLMLSVFFTLFLAFLAWYLPHMLAETSVAPIWVAFTLALLMYLGIAFGIAKYRLFDLDRWWVNAWAWFFSGILIIGLDSILILVFHLNLQASLLVTMIIIGWIYFPIRQWLQRSLLKNHRDHPTDHMPEMIKAIFSANSPQDIPSAFENLLKEVYRPLVVKQVSSSETKSQLLSKGAHLLVPLVNTERALILTHAAQGKTLFKPEHVTLSDSLKDAFQNYSILLEERIGNARTERQRIARDLHDDVAANLLSLIHRNHAPERTEKLARKALESLKDSLTVLDDREFISLDTLLNRLEEDSRTRLEDSDILLEWNNQLETAQLELNGRERINLTRIVQESISNLIKHSSGPLTEMVVIEDQNILTICLKNHTRDSQLPETVGKGLHNIKTRAQELGGNAHWTVEERPDARNWFVLTALLRLNGGNVCENSINR